MIYAVSDLHGCYDRYRQLLDKLDLEEQDTLYVLGDVIDRGPNGFQIMLDIASRPNVVCLMGNHEAMAKDALPAIWDSLESRNRFLNLRDRENVSLWFHNGGKISVQDFLWLDKPQKDTVWEYLLSLPLYREVEVGSRKFVLVHGGLGHFFPSRSLENYSRDEIVWCRPEPDTVYFPDRCVVLGHTPTQLLYRAVGHGSTQGRIYRTESFIDIDCGCVYPGGRLGCLCLDTMEEIYV